MQVAHGAFLILISDMNFSISIFPLLAVYQLRMLKSDVSAVYAVK